MASTLNITTKLNERTEEKETFLLYWAVKFHMLICLHERNKVII